jgi:hypothetical protein
VTDGIDQQGEAAPTTGLEPDHEFDSERSEFEPDAAPEPDVAVPDALEA